MMNLTVYSMDHLTQRQKERQAAFYSFLYEKMTDPSPNNEISFARFLTNQFNSFPVGKGYPIIGKSCQFPQCYFYVMYEQAKDLDHNFFRFLNKQINNLKCKCGNTIRKIDDFVYDSPLAGFLQLKLNENQLSSIKSIQITKNHEVYLESKGTFQQSFNKARLQTISELLPQLSKRQQGQGKQSKTSTLKVDSQTIMQLIQQRIASHPQLTGIGKCQQGNLMKEEDKLTAILPHFVIKQSKGSIYMYKQTREEQKFCSVPLQLQQKLSQKLLDYYDFSQFTYYYLNSNAQLFKCDLRCMYNFSTNAYLLSKLCSLSFDPRSVDKQYSALLVRKQKIYLFCAKPGEQFVNLLKGYLPPSPSEDKLSMKPILPNKLRNRRGYSVGWIKANTLIQDQCIIMFGGIIERVKNFKLLQIVGLGMPQEKYLLHKITIRQEQFNEVSCCHPTITVFSGRLIVIGGVDYSQAQPRQNRNIALLPLKQGIQKVEIRQILGQDKKEEVIERVAGGVHVGQGWMVAMNKSNRRLYPLISRLRKGQNGDLEIEKIQ